MTKEEMYQQHIDTMFGTKDMLNFSNEEVDETLDNLIACMPNEGKLYKYRKISDKNSFDKVLKSLKECTLWSSRVDEFTDKTDCTVYYDPLEEAKRIENLLRGNPELILSGIMRSISKEVQKENPNFDKSMLLRLVDCYDKEGDLSEEKALNIFKDYGCDINESKFAIKEINSYVQNALKNNDNIIKGQVENFLKFNQVIRSSAFVCSLCEDYKVKTMWEHYAYNKGICIEYDFNKLQNMSYDIKRFFCSTYKVRYVDDHEEISFVPLIREFLEGKNEKSTNTKLNKQILTSQITKTYDYAYEKEWRTFHFSLNDKEKGHIVKADIVSGIIIDENSINTYEGKQIIDLAQKRKWDIKVRLLNITSTRYNFVSYEDYQKEE